MFKKCLNCDCEIEDLSGSHNRKFCKECRYLIDLCITNYAQRSLPIIKICIQCKKNFIIHNGNQKYCSKKCFNIHEKNSKKGHILKLIGCSIEFLKSYIEKQFTKDMSWSNYGDWHLDHIKPCCSFNLNKPEEQFKCFNYKNLQPLWAVDNLHKHCK